MSRIQLAINVTDVDSAVSFYERLFGTPAAKRKDGYANFEIAEPPLKLVLIESAEGGTLNHLGVETTTAAEVAAAEARLSGAGLQTTGVDDTTCCYATKTETWVTDPDGAKWEWYVKTGDADQLTNQIVDNDASTMCCAPGGTETSCAPTEPVAIGAGPSAHSGCCQ